MYPSLPTPTLSVAGTSNIKLEMESSDCDEAMYCKLSISVLGEQDLTKDVKITFTPAEA